MLSASTAFGSGYKCREMKVEFRQGPVPRFGGPRVWNALFQMRPHASLRLVCYACAVAQTVKGRSIYLVNGENDASKLVDPVQ